MKAAVPIVMSLQGDARLMPGVVFSFARQDLAEMTCGACRVLRMRPHGEDQRPLRQRSSRQIEQDSHLFGSNWPARERIDRNYLAKMRVVLRGHVDNRQPLRVLHLDKRRMIEQCDLLATRCHTHVRR